MKDAKDLRRAGIEEVLESIGSDEPSSGAGIAAALALALATACALKAVKVTLKHRCDDDLEKCCRALVVQRDRALAAARADAETFGKYLQDHAPRDAARLVLVAEEFQALSREIAAELEELEESVVATVAADVVAARTLHAAAVSIEGLILRDSRQLRARTMP